MEQFIMGAIAMASAVVALFFLRFWRETGDRLFAIFASAFVLLGISTIGPGTFAAGNGRTYPLVLGAAGRFCADLAGDCG